MNKLDTRATVYLVEDEGAVRESLSALLSAHGYPTVPCRSAETFLESFDGTSRAIILLDLRLPGMSGLDLQSQLNARGAHPPILVLTAHGDVPIAVQAMRAGAYDFIEKPADPERLLESLDEAGSLLRNRRPSGPSRQVVAERLARLTEREREVLHHLLEGQLNKEIAETLGVSRRTVEVHRARIREKMQARGIADLIRMVG